MKTYKAKKTDLRVRIMDALNLPYELENNMIVYKGILETSLVSFLVTKGIELNMHY